MVKNTLLHFIVQLPCKEGKEEEAARTIIQAVVNSGGESVLTKQNLEGMTPMMLCLQKKKKCIPLLEILLDMTARDDATDYNGDTLVHHAARNLGDKNVEQMKSILAKHSGFLEKHNKNGESPFDVESKQARNSPMIKNLLMVGS